MKSAAERLLAAAVAELDRAVELLEEQQEQLVETRKERVYALIGGFMFGVLATLAVHAQGWF